MVVAAQEQPDPVLKALRAELDRSLQNLKKQPVPPYFLAYQVTDNRAIQIGASFGTLQNSDDTRTRVLDIDLRVGDFALDNTHDAFVRGGMPRQFDSRLPLDDDPAAVRQSLWAETDKHYKAAVERLAEIKANVQVKAEREDKSPDFTPEKPERFLGPPEKFSFDQRGWEDRLRRVTAPFARYGFILEQNANVSGEIETRRYVSSEGSEIVYTLPLYRLVLTATAKAEDGMMLPLQQTFLSFSPEGLPDEATLTKVVEKMINDLRALRAAPVIDAYTGPAILTGRASAVFFHEIFGHRIEGQRQKDEDDAQTFKKKVGQSVLPPSFSVYSDPTLRKIGSTDLVGFYPYDDQGVKARRVPVVEKGILKNFLMSRSPIEGFTASNGHGRRQQGNPVAARQSNLLVEASKQVTRAELKKKLLEQIKAAKKPYGLLFDDIEGGFTFTQRFLPNAFNVMPTMLYRVYPDGREELVRGADLIGTPLIAFSKILAADDDVAVFNGVCGAESGWVPVSAVSPGILVAQIEIQRKPKSQESDPVLPPPFAVEK